MTRPELISHTLCPYVQRAAIVLLEKGAAFDRRYVDLAAKPDWFMAISPLGKVPLLRVDGDVLFESTVICEFLEETIPDRPLHPADPIARARHRGWMEFGSALLNDIAGFYAAADEATFETRRLGIDAKLARLEAVLGAGPWFAGEGFSMVDAVFAPVFRYFDQFERIRAFGLFTGRPKLQAWRAALADRPSVRHSVVPDFAARLTAFLAARDSHLASLMQPQTALAG